MLNMLRFFVFLTLMFVLCFLYFLPFQGTARARSSTAADNVGGQGAP